MSQTRAPIRVTDIRTVGVSVVDQDGALEFFVGTLGFEKRMDVPLGIDARWIVVAPQGATTTIALVRSSEKIPAGVETGVRFVTPDADADHAGLVVRGVAVDDVLAASRPTRSGMATSSPVSSNTLVRPRRV